MSEIELPVQQPSGAGGFDLARVPRVVLVAGIGGLAGLIYFLYKRSNSGSSASSGVSNVGLPNTTVMLSSLQGQLLDLQHSTDQGTADVLGALTTDFNNITTQTQSQADTLASQIGTLQGLTADQTAQLKQAILDQSAATQTSILGSLQSGFGGVSTAISDVSNKQDYVFGIIQSALSQVQGAQQAQGAMIGQIQNIIASTVTSLPVTAQGQANCQTVVLTRSDNTSDNGRQYNARVCTNPDGSQTSSFLGWVS